MEKKLIKIINYGHSNQINFVVIVTQYSLLLYSKTFNFVVIVTKSTLLS